MGVRKKKSEAIILLELIWQSPTGWQD